MKKRTLNPNHIGQIWEIVEGENPDGTEKRIKGKITNIQDGKYRFDWEDKITTFEPSLEKVRTKGRGR